MNKEQELSDLQGKWVGEIDATLTFEITHKVIIDQANKKDELFWRDGLNKWIIPGFSIRILSIEVGKMVAETPTGNLQSGVEIYVRA